MSAGPFYPSTVHFHLVVFTILLYDGGRRGRSQEFRKELRYSIYMGRRQDPLSAHYFEQFRISKHIRNGSFHHQFRCFSNYITGKGSGSGLKNQSAFSYGTGNLGAYRRTQKAQA